MTLFLAHSRFSNQEFLRNCPIASSSTESEELTDYKYLSGNSPGLFIGFSKFQKIEYRFGVLRTQDVLVVLRLLLSPEQAKPTLQELSVELGISASQIHAAIRRAAQSRLVDEKSREVNRTNLSEFLVHGLKYAFPPQFSSATRGVPTSIAAPPLSEQFSLEEGLLPVWPHPQGHVAGLGLEPIHPAVPGAAMKNPELHEWLALVDAVRAGRGRERAMAARELERRLA